MQQVLLAEQSSVPGVTARHVWNLQNASAPVLTSYSVSSVRTAYAWPRVCENRGWSRIFSPVSHTSKTVTTASTACSHPRQCK